VATITAQHVQPFSFFDAYLTYAKCYVLL